MSMGSPCLGTEWSTCRDRVRFRAKVRVRARARVRVRARVRARPRITLPVSG